MQTWHIHIEGQVQGVGFRPYVWQRAQNHQLKGWVNNAGDGVHIVFDASREQAESFFQDIGAHPPQQAKVVHQQLYALPDKNQFRDFKIIQSDDNVSPSLLVTPDFGLCRTCRAELHDPHNRRHGYPFITCTQCGPRFSLMQSLPYDRDHTTMEPFSMCRECQQEYKQPRDRRFFSQTNSCPHCGVQLRLIDRNRNRVATGQEDILALAKAAWAAGEVVAIKGIGGFLLTCDATNSQAIEELRRRKQRPSKPLAVMFPGLAAAQEVVALSEVEAAALLSPLAPIVLAEQRASPAQTLPLQHLAPGLKRLGIMLPYTPLLECLLSAFNRPIVATSGNISGSPIIHQEKQAVEELSGIADWILSDNRELALPQDDTVLQYSKQSQQKIIIRRSRGLAPSLSVGNLNLGPKAILATGAQLKSTFAFWQNHQCYISPYLGDQDAYLSQQHYRSSLEHIQQLIQAEPQVIISDSHPEYAASLFAKEKADTLQLEHLTVQHHKAHFAAVLAEHNLLDSSTPCLGIIWDGTGYGTDGQIWGGEFFTYADYQIQRLAHWAYQPQLAGDKMAREPRLAALSFCRAIPEAQSLLRQKFNPAEWAIYQQLLKRDHQMGNSSVGRLFDTVACILGLGDTQSYEGEAATRLEALASSYVNQKGVPTERVYGHLVSDTSSPIVTELVLADLIADVSQGVPAGQIAARFHYSLVQQVRAVADAAGIQHLAFSGGVFQNALLVDLLHEYLPSSFHAYFHQELSPNDENISFGQMAYYYIQQQAATHQNQSNYVFSDSRKN